MKQIDRTTLIEFLSNAETPVTKRELARALNVKGDDRILLKQLLRELEEEGVLVKQPGQEYAVPKGLPSVGIIEITDIDVDGDMLARPTEWNEAAQGPMPRIEVAPVEGRGHPALEEGDRALAKLKRKSDTLYEAQVIRKLDTPQGHVMGLVKRHKNAFVLQPTDKRAKYDFDLAQADLNGATDGDLAVGEIQPARGLKRKKVRVIEVIGRENDPKAISLIALYEAGIKPEFPQEVLAATETMDVPDLKGREDLRAIPLVTIDGADARDFDDAVFAEKDGGGYHLLVAIADVSYYVRPDTAINREAYRRGNSTYFPDRVVPMLPERLSNDLCSLRPRENRACLAMHMWIDRNGEMQRHKVVRGLMRSEARLTYEQVQAAKDGLTDDTTGPIMEKVIEPLYAAYDLLWRAREKRGALDLDLPERKIVIDENNRMTGVKLRERLDSHKLIEEFMILANVAAAQALEAKKAPCVYRVHDKPDPKKLDSAREFLESFELSLPKGQSIKPAQINMILHKAADLPFSHLVSEVILRSQSQAHYHIENVGHFGLALNRYAHFTSPIRRYADLLVHRSLIRAYNLGPGGLDQGEEVRLEEMCQHISDTERQSMEAERAAVDRFTAQFLSQKIGAQFGGRISGVTRFGLFVKLDESGADGLIPIRSLPGNDFYIHDEKQHALIGKRSGRVYRMGARVQVSLTEADGMTGSTILALTNDESAEIPGFSIKKSVPFERKRNIHNKYKDKHRRHDNERGDGGHKPGKGKKGRHKGKHKR
jgi:ribonuclease R